VTSPQQKLSIRQEVFVWLVLNEFSTGETFVIIFVILRTGCDLLMGEERLPAKLLTSFIVSGMWAWKKLRNVLALLGMMCALGWRATSPFCIEITFVLCGQPYRKRYTNFDTLNMKSIPGVPGAIIFMGLRFNAYFL
jgi:hypothetical protein